MKVDKAKWEIVPFNKVGTIELGKTLNSNTDKGELCPYLCSVNVGMGIIDLSTLKQCRIEENEKERYSVKRGDLLVCEGGDAGRCAIWNDDVRMFYQNAIHRIRVNDAFDNRFVMRYLHFLKKVGEIDKKSKGVTIKHFTKKALLSLDIPCPPLSEQRAIAVELDSIQQVIDKLQEQLKDYDALAQSIFHEMFGEIKTHQQLKKCAKIGTGATPSRKVKEFYNGHIPWVKSTEVKNCLIFDTQEKITEEAIKMSNCSVYTSNTVLIAMYGQGKTRGQVALLKVDAATNQACAAIRCNSSLNPLYLYWFLQINYDNNRKLGNGTNQKNMNLSIVGSIEIPLPPLPLQQKFAERVEAIEAQKAMLQQQIAEARQLMDSRMQYYFE